MRNPDGSATCDRCDLWLPGYGILHGLCSTDLARDRMRELIFCYRNNCRTIMLAGMVNLGGDPLSCTHCGVGLGVRSVSTAMLASDIHPGVPDAQRLLQFCYINGSRDAFLLPLMGGLE